MAIKNIKLQNATGDELRPQTSAALVLTAGGGNLGEVEPAAQVNVIESIKVNGTPLSITDKAVDITIDAEAEYQIVKAETAETGYLATYELQKDGVKAGASINIPKDFLVKSASVKVCEGADTPVAGYKVGDKYIDFVINAKDGGETDEHLYVLVSDLVDVYTAGNGVKVEGNVISIDNTVVAVKGDLAAKLSDLTDDSATTPIAKAVEAGTLTGLEASVAELNYVKGVSGAIQGQIDTKVAKNADIVGGTKCKITYDAKGLVTGGADLEAADIPAISLAKVSDVTATAAEVNKLAGLTTTAAELGYVHGVTSNIQEQLDGKQAKIEGAQLNALNSGITAAKVEAYDGYAATIAGKADKATTLAGYGITDAYTKTDVYTKAEVDAILLSYVELEG